MDIIKNLDFWDVLIALMALLGGHYYYRRERHRGRKSLIVEQTSWSTITNEAIRIDGKPLRVFLGEQPVRNFAISRIKIANTGGAPILASDFEREVVIRFVGIDEIYYTDLQGRTSSSLAPGISVQGEGEVMIKPLLLNSGDSFVVEVGVDLNRHDVGPSIEAFGRIAGVSDIEIRAAPGIDVSGVPEIKAADQPDSGHLLGAAFLGLIGGAALTFVLAVFVFNSFAEKTDGGPPHPAPASSPAR